MNEAPGLRADWQLYTSTFQETFSRSYLSVSSGKTHLPNANRQASRMEIRVCATGEEALGAVGVEMKLAAVSASTPAPYCSVTVFRVDPGLPAHRRLIGCYCD